MPSYNADQVLGQAFDDDNNALRVSDIGSAGTGTLNNGAEVAVGAAAVPILAANAARKAAIIQNVGANNVRIGAAGVAPNTGTRLKPGEALVYGMPFVPTNAIFAIREGASDSIVLAQEVN